MYYLAGLYEKDEGRIGIQPQARQRKSAEAKKRQTIYHEKNVRKLRLSLRTLVSLFQNF